MSHKIPLLIPYVPSLEILTKYLRRIDSAKIYSNFGPLETELRNRLADIWKVSAENVVTANNATMALQGAIETSEPNNKPWNVPSWTFVATPLAIRSAGKPFKFVDVDSETWRAIFSEDDENLVDVLPFGDELDFERLRKTPITNLVIDAAASFAALSKPLPLSLHNYMIIFSLHATKLLPAGEGSVVVTNCADWATRFRSWTSFGFSTSRRSILSGTNAKLSEYAAAVALGSLDEFDNTKERIATAQRSAAKISFSLGLRTQPSMRKGLASPYWIVQFESPEQKRKVREALAREAIESRNWWEEGCHKEDIFKSLDVYLPVTDSLSATTLGLPMYPGISTIELERIQKAIYRAT